MSDLKNKKIDGLETVMFNAYSSVKWDLSRGLQVTGMERDEDGYQVEFVKNIEIDELKDVIARISTSLEGLNRIAEVIETARRSISKS